MNLFVPVKAAVALGPEGPPLSGVTVLPPKSLNTSAYLDINHFSRQTAWAHGFMHAYALWLGPVLLAALFVAVYALAWWRRLAGAAVLLILGGIGTVIALGLNQLVAHAARELRPYFSHPNALVLVAKTSDYSFPSDHSIVAGGLTASLLLVAGDRVWSRWREKGRSSALDWADEERTRRIVRVFAGANVVLGLFLCFARVYVGAHYPGDVVAGYLLSALTALVVSLLRPFAYRAIDITEPTMLAALVRRPGTRGATGDPESEPLPR